MRLCVALFGICDTIVIFPYWYDDKLELVRKDSYLQQLEELEKLAHTTGDRVIQIRRDGFIEAGKLMGLIE